MSPIDDALRQLERHRGIKRVGRPVTAGDHTDIEVDIAVELPSRAREAGVSATGVRALENCILRFGEGWPLAAPRVLLRADFPTDLPHINPHVPGALVPPCLFDGSLDELLHRFGLDSIVDQLIDWLHRAAGGTLMETSQGWEPMRRDSCPSTLVVSAERLVAAIGPGTMAVIESDYFLVPPSHGIWATLNPALTVNGNVAFDQQRLKTSGDEFFYGTVAAFIARTPKACPRYLPDAVHDFDSLMTFAQALGIDASRMRDGIYDYYSRAILNPQRNIRTWTHGIYGVVVLLVERPTALIGAAGRNVEVIPYAIRFEVMGSTSIEPKPAVHPCSHAHALSSELLARTSGLALHRAKHSLVLLGCGSLGSKLALHLGRAGMGQITFVDSELMAPHNNARHALIPHGSQSLGSRGKADLMKEAFERLSHADCRSFRNDAVEMLLTPVLFNTIVPQTPTLIVDATASLQMLAAAVSPNELDKSPARFLRTALYGQGRCGIALLESEGRTCRVDDLTAYVFERCRSDTKLRNQMAGDTTDLTRVFVGDNCRSLTARMSDARVSRAAALIATQLERWMTDLPSGAHIGIAIADAANIGMDWSCTSLGETTRLYAREEGGWQIRVLKPVTDAIQLDVDRWSPKETGGAVIGRVDYANRTVTIAGLVEAPPDSVREKARFVLGKEGLAQTLRRAHEESVGYLTFLGTWHSHPAGGAHSGIDRSTLAHIAESAAGMPAVSLIWTPHGYECSVDRW